MFARTKIPSSHGRPTYNPSRFIVVISHITDTLVVQDLSARLLSSWVLIRHIDCLSHTNGTQAPSTYTPRPQKILSFVLLQFAVLFTVRFGNTTESSARRQNLVTVGNPIYLRTRASVICSSRVSSKLRLGISCSRANNHFLFLGWKHFAGKVG